MPKILVDGQIPIDIILRYSNRLSVTCDDYHTLNHSLSERTVTDVVIHFSPIDIEEWTMITPEIFIKLVQKGINPPLSKLSALLDLYPEFVFSMSHDQTNLFWIMVKKSDGYIDYTRVLSDKLFCNRFSEYEFVDSILREPKSDIMSTFLPNSTRSDIMSAFGPNSTKSDATDLESLSEFDFL